MSATCRRSGTVAGIAIVGIIAIGGTTAIAGIVIIGTIPVAGTAGIGTGARASASI